MREHREVYFSTEAVISAVTALMVSNGTPPRGFIARLRYVEGEGSVSAIATIMSTKYGRPQELSLSGEHLCAALIAACRAARVPLPRAAEKRLVISGNGLALHVDLYSSERSLNKRSHNSA
jgi:hypothetical protein